MDGLATVTTRQVEYDADGMTMVGHLALPAGTGNRAGVLIGHEGIGLNDFQRRRADLLAEHGYVTLAMDYHGGRLISDPAEMIARCQPLLANPDRMRAIGHAALDVLRAEVRTDASRLAAIGYGTGGTIALELGRAGVDLKAIAGVDWRLNIYGGAYHAFHHPPTDADGSVSTATHHRANVLSAVRYHHAHAQRAWRAILDLLDETLQDDEAY